MSALGHLLVTAVANYEQAWYFTAVNRGNHNNSQAITTISRKTNCKTDVPNYGRPIEFDIVTRTHTCTISDQKKSYLLLVVVPVNGGLWTAPAWEAWLRAQESSSK